MNQIPWQFRFFKSFTVNFENAWLHLEFFFLINCEFFNFFRLQKTSLDMETAAVHDDPPILSQVQFKQMYLPKHFSQQCNHFGKYI